MTQNHTRSLRGTRPAGRSETLLARIRQKQLHLAMTGRPLDSARYAQRAGRVRLTGGVA